MSGHDEVSVAEKSDSSTEAANSPKVDSFKKPQMCLIGPRRSKGSKVRVVDCLPEVKEKGETQESPTSPAASSPLREAEGEPSDRQTEVGCDEDSPSLPQISKPRKSAPSIPAQKLKETPIPYLEPKWGGVPSVEYSLDVIKSGTVLEPIDLSSKSYHVFGRQTNCDIQMAHPTVSRHHAVLQYSRGTDDKPEGYYLYDLGSTHGTFLNKCRVRPEIFIRIKVGHQIKLGGSTRLYLLQGPPDDMEEESELSVTELKAKRQLELQARELAEINRKQKEEEEEKRRAEAGVDWGMGDDADEETDLSENPYATTTNEDLYIDDPKKTLRGWFEREGHELEYDVEEKGPGQFLCRIDVPVEGARGGCMVAEALVKGKKKEAVAQCALEACRLLDRLGLLRQATHESRKRKAKNWEEDDFYDSDDDAFLDRTGAVEKKRQQRMKHAGKGEEQVETYQSLCEKHSEVLKKLKCTQAALNKAQADLELAKMREKSEEEGDTLDSFMSTLSKIGSTDKVVISKLKNDLTAVLKEEAHLRKLVNIAKPASLPELVPPGSLSDSSSTKDPNLLKNKLMIAARKKANEKQKIVATVSRNDSGQFSHSKSSYDDGEEEIEEEDYEEEERKGKGSESRTFSPYQPDVKNLPSASESSFKESEEKGSIMGPPKPSFSLKPEPEIEHCEKKEEVDREADDGDDDEEEERSLKDSEKRKRKNRRRLLLRNEKALERTKAQYDTSDPNYSVWVPPEDQSGDGTTKLNAKLGY